MDFVEISIKNLANGVVINVSESESGHAYELSGRRKGTYCEEQKGQKTLDKMHNNPHLLTHLSTCPPIHPSIHPSVHFHN